MKTWSPRSTLAPLRARTCLKAWTGLRVKYAAAFFSLLAAALAAPVAHAAAVTTEQGVVQGTTVGHVEMFFGVPFATPPVGDLRWRQPRPPQPYAGGVLQATSFTPPCYQGGAATATLPAPSEDCLYLNIWRPVGASAGAGLPVLVYIYGGGFAGGNGSAFDGTPLVTTSNMLFVTINYRVGAFGWLALPGLDEETRDGASSGNYGFLDMVQALRWINQNIEAFGGNPSNVSIAGTSAGGIAVCMFLAAPLKEELFQKAIIESGECTPSSVFIVSHQQELATGANFAANVGCTDPSSFASCLRAAPASKLLSAASAAGRFTANVGGALVPVHPFRAMASGRIAEVPVIVGANHDEQKGGGLATTGFPGSVTGYETYLDTTFGLLAPLVMAKYPAADYSDPAYAAGAAVTDSGAPSGIGVCPMLFAQADALAGNTPTYAYELDDPNGGRLGAFPAGFEVGSEHAAEVKFLYNGYIGVLQPPGVRPDEQSMAGSMLRYWASFAASGQPSDGTLAWPRYASGSEKVLRFQPSGNIALARSVVYDDHNCGFWEDLGFMGRLHDAGDSGRPFTRDR
jgi:para-nitrobenzyl esterase